MDTAVLQRAAPPFGIILVSSMALSAQWLFANIEPGPLRKGEMYTFNVLVTCLLICWWRSCFTDPGRIPKDWDKSLQHSQDGSSPPPRQRYCRKCEAPKPPRSHHCKACKRCIAKMDHHCVWTANCVSHITLPHFIRFLIYAVTATSYLEYFLYGRCAVIWQKRHLPSYLGPSIFQLSLLLILVLSNSFILFMLSLLLGRTLWSAALNMTTIESWEIERHEALLRRARVLGGYLVGPNGDKVRVQRQEFPWDIGIWKNICAALGTRNPLAWLWPFAASPRIESGLSFEHNEIEDPAKPWPPPDPDRAFRTYRAPMSTDGFTQSMDIEDFRQRQLADFARYTDVDGEYVVRRRPFHQRLAAMSRSGDGKVEQDDQAAIEGNEDDSGSDEDIQDEKNDDAGEEGWRNQEGERLQDFGVDAIADFYDEDDMPLAQLIQTRKLAQS